MPAAVRVLLAATVLATLTAPAGAGSRFFVSGDGELDLYNGHFDEHLTVRYRDADGRYDAGALARLERFFRSRTDGRQEPVSLRLVELIDYVEDRYRPRRLTLISGYRSPNLNDLLRTAGGRVAKGSLHTEGLAADLQPDGLRLRRLWLDLREQRVGGVGLYERDGFLHLDAGRPRFWEAATSGTEQNLSAENARVFARTEFDRYDDLDGAVIRLHAITALPLRIKREARMGRTLLRVVAAGGELSDDGECWVIAQPARRYELRIATAAPPPARRAPIRLFTCTPRVGATPEEILTNPVERLAAE